MDKTVIERRPPPPDDVQRPVSLENPMHVTRSSRLDAPASSPDEDPFHKSIEIVNLRMERNLQFSQIIPDTPPVEEPFRRRNKRVMKERAWPIVTNEVGFFTSFWELFDADKQSPRMLLDAVLKRYLWRLRATKVDHAVARKKASRGRRKQNDEEEKEEVVEFVSITDVAGSGGVKGDFGPELTVLDTQPAANEPVKYASIGFPRLIDWLSGWMIDWSIVWLNGWMVEWIVPKVWLLISSQKSFDFWFYEKLVHNK